MTDHNLLGISQLMDSSKLRKDIDPLKLEREYLHGTEGQVQKHREDRSEEKFNAELSDWSKELGIDFEIMSTKSSSSRGSHKSASSRKSSISGKSTTSSRSKRSSTSSKSSRSSASSSSSKSSAKSKKEVDKIISEMKFHSSSSSKPATASYNSEQVMNVKLAKLEQILQLKQVLEDENFDLDRSLTSLTINDSMEQIDTTLYILKNKTNRIRYSSMAKEVILGLAEVVESVFDGSTEIPFLNWTPNYTGLKASLNTKLSRCQVETSTIVGEIVEKNNIPPWGKLALELGPSVLLFPIVNSNKRTGGSGLYNAISDINEKNRQKALLDISNL